MTEERRVKDRRASPAVGDFALQEREGLLARIAELEAIVPIESELRAKAERAAAELERELAALKAQQPSAGGVEERAAFEGAWPSISAELPSHQRNQYAADEIEYSEKEAAQAGWQARARLNPCRAQAVPDGWKSIALYADQLADMVLKGDAPHTAQRIAMALRAMLASRQDKPVDRRAHAKHCLMLDPEEPECHCTCRPVSD